MLKPLFEKHFSERTLKLSISQNGIHLKELIKRLKLFPPPKAVLLLPAMRDKEHGNFIFGRDFQDHSSQASVH